MFADLKLFYRKGPWCPDGGKKFLGNKAKVTEGTIESQTVRLQTSTLPTSIHAVQVESNLHFKIYLLVHIKSSFTHQ